MALVDAEEDDEADGRGPRRWGQGGHGRTRWPAMRVNDEVDLEVRESDEGERGRGKISAQGEWSRRGREGGGRLPYPLTDADDVVRRGVAPVATAPGEQGE